MENQDDQKPRNEQSGVCYSFGDDCRRATFSDQAFNQKFDREAVVLDPGGVAFQDDKSRMLVTTIGSGIVLTIYDDILRFGVMACPLLTPEIHAVFPRFDAVPPDVLRKVSDPIDMAINEMKKHGAGKGRIRVRLFGGANLSSDEGDKGTKNYVFVKEYLSRKGLSVMGEDIGGTNIRRIHFVPDEGAITRFVLKRESDIEDLMRSENTYFDY